MPDAGTRDVDTYIAAAPKSAQPMLRQLRQVIRAAAPRADERISYGMPFYEHHGRLVYFAGYEHHIGLYAAIPSNNSYASELKEYRAAKSAIRFPVGQPLPVALIRKVVEARVRENEAKVQGADRASRRKA
ncbi:MAG: DUF1801 domain-containing protein [Candidatus Dormibacteraeota bacterium]|nr:DUF1801 domain-containing protein [Candidatus Dormibacteraeota bacterium]